MRGRLSTPITPDQISRLHVGDMIFISGNILAGRDAVLPRVCALLEAQKKPKWLNYIQGGVVFHTAVSPAGVGPTSSNKIDIEGSIAPLSEAGVRIHLGKGSISHKTVMDLEANHSCFAVLPPISALLSTKTLETEVLAFPELGMEALHRLKVESFPAIVAAVNGDSLF